MKIEIDISKIMTAIILAIIMYIGKTVHDIEINQKLIQYQIEQIYPILQEHSEKIDKLEGTEYDKK